ncbi:MAG: hypothetical protein PHR77_19065, partial [Kiritimatiellae bacterium]|nr:hypothetical protein [Kiritimatiellia bacterium]
KQTCDQALDFHSMTLSLPKKQPDPRIPVVVLELDGLPNVETVALQQPDGSITLPIHMAAFNGPDGSRTPNLTRGGLLNDWRSTQNWVSWPLKVKNIGEYNVRLVLGSPHWETKVRGGHKVAVTIGGQTLKGTVTSDEEIKSVRTTHFWLAATNLGRIRLEKAGTMNLELRAEEIAAKAPSGLTLLSLELIPVK